MIPVMLASLCPATVADLPAHAELYSAADPRLSSHRLVVVMKDERRLAVYEDGSLLRRPDAPACWSIGLAPAYPKGPKRQQGDRKTPEGWYRTSDFPTSTYYRAIYVHYPNVADADAGLEAGTLTRAQRDAAVQALSRDERPDQYTGMGGAILIHGGGSSYDWTLGCIALEDRDLDALHAELPGDKRFDLLILP